MAEMQAMEYKPTLTLVPDSTDSPTAAMIPDESALEINKDEVAGSKLDISQLTEEEQKQVRDFAEKIDITDTNAVLTFGAASQRNIANFSENTLKNVRSKDMGDVGKMLSGLVVELRGFGDTGEGKRGFLGLRKRISSFCPGTNKAPQKVPSNSSIVSAAILVVILALVSLLLTPLAQAILAVSCLGRDRPLEKR